MQEQSVSLRPSFTGMSSSCRSPSGQKTSLLHCHPLATRMARSGREEMGHPLRGRDVEVSESAKELIDLSLRLHWRLDLDAASWEQPAVAWSCSGAVSRKKGE